MSLCDALIEVFTQALVFRCSLCTARETFSFKWYAAGEKWEGTAMGSLNGEGPVVLVTMFPALMMVRGDGMTTTVAKAQVLVRLAEPDDVL